MVVEQGMVVMVDEEAMEVVGLVEMEEVVVE